jgi:transketolase
VTAVWERGLGIAVGMAHGLKRKKSKSFVYNLFSDGELEGLSQRF